MAAKRRVSAFEKRAFEYVALQEAKDRITELEQQVAEARQDAERLDWIERYKRPMDYWSIRVLEQPLTLWLQSGCTSYPADGQETKTLRQQIDAARQKEGK